MVKSAGADGDQKINETIEDIRKKESKARKERDEPLPSFGVSSQLFLPGGFYLDLYNLNAVLESLWIMHLTGSLNVAIWRFGLAVGYTYNNFARQVYQGPSLGISFWL